MPYYNDGCISLYVHAKLLQPCLALCNAMDCIAFQVPLAMGFSRQEYWSELPCPPPEDLPNPGVEPRSPTLEVNSLLSEPPGKPIETVVASIFYSYESMILKRLFFP